MSYYSRNLPHWHPSGTEIFITWRLHGSLPPAFTQKVVVKTAAESGEQFRIVDEELDHASTGPRWLENPRIADVVVETIKVGQNKLQVFDLHAFVVMPNHVHMLISPKVPVARITKGIKGVSSRKSNIILGQVGLPFLAAGVL
jgi:putative transposase